MTAPTDRPSSPVYAASVMRARESTRSLLVGEAAWLSRTLPRRDATTPADGRTVGVDRLRYRSVLLALVTGYLDGLADEIETTRPDPDRITAVLRGILDALTTTTTTRTGTTTTAGRNR